MNYRKYRLELVLLSLFALLTSFSFHGFSIAAWHRVIDGSEPSEVWIGTPQEFRSDDWSIFIPMAFSQTTSRVRFQTRNPLVGDGDYDVVVNFALPSFSPVTLFRPQLWGFFSGKDFGLSWLWWFNLLGLFYCFVVVARKLMPEASGEELWAGAFVVGSPFFPMWSYNTAHLVVFAVGATVFFLRFLTSSRTAVVLGNALVFGYFLTAFVFGIYPPFQICLGYLCLVLAGVWVARHRQEVRLRFSRVHVAALLLALAAVTAVVAWFWLSNRAHIALVTGMEYPAQRRIEGGSLPLAYVFSNSFFLHLFGRSHEFFGGNICESALAPFLFPLFAVYLGVRWLAGGRKPSLLLCALFGISSALVIWMVWGFPAWLGGATLFDRMPERRSGIGLVLSEALMLCALASAARETPVFSSKDPDDRLAATIALTFWVALLAILAPVVFIQGGYTAGAMIAAAALLLGLSVLWLRSTKVAFRVWVACAFLSGVWFNPLTRGGARYLEDNALSVRIKEADRAMEGRSVWLAFAPPLGNLFRAIGVRSLDGSHFYRQDGIWKKIDPEGRYFRQYNRYANVKFLPAPRGAAVNVEVPFFDSVVVKLDPCSPILKELGVTHVLLPANDMRTCPQLREISSTGKFRIAEVQ